MRWLGQIYWLNCGLARWDALSNVPVFQSFWILVSVIGGGVFYNEFNDFSVLQWIMFPLGVLLTIIGVYYLSQREIASVSKRRASTGGSVIDGDEVRDPAEVGVVVMKLAGFAGQRVWTSGRFRHVVTLS